MNLVRQFEAAAKAAGATVEFVPRDSSCIARSIASGFPDAKRIALADPIYLPWDLFAECRRLPGLTQTHSKRELAAVDLGITEAFAGVARTGSICVSVDSGLAGYASLLGRIHVAILAVESIVERPADLFRFNAPGQEVLRRNFVFVTGPSATADMGQLVRGVHGPHQVHIMILE